MATLTITFRLAWWFDYYLYGVAFMCALTGCEPNMERITYWARKAIRVVAK